MKTRITVTILVMLAAEACFAAGAEPAGSYESVLGRTFELAGRRSQETRQFEMESRLIHYALDGTRVSTDVYKLRLKCVPAKLSGKAGDEYTCLDFTLKIGDAPEVSIPSLKGWSYVFNMTPTNLDGAGQVLGIDHAKFVNLKDAKGNAIPQANAYHVYNAFIDFHSFCNVFAERTAGGKGIQDLSKIGDRIVHASAFSEPPVDVGSNVAKGSFFKNGEITLEFKGLCLADNAPCAIVTVDSGQSSFKMIMNPRTDMEARAVGSSHYKGDIYIDLATKWVKKVTFDELVITESNMPAMQKKTNEVVERNITIRNIKE
ncbi:MAG: hypothetical protein JW947_00420 [Sedimentisphaerales bacterium]|nr:hypothetical protein [Sedimentisphaerales bacterium]